MGGWGWARREWCVWGGMGMSSTMPHCRTGAMHALMQHGAMHACSRASCMHAAEGVMHASSRGRHACMQQRASCMRAAGRQGQRTPTACASQPSTMQRCLDVNARRLLASPMHLAHLHHAALLGRHGQRDAQRLDVAHRTRARALVPSAGCQGGISHPSPGLHVTQLLGYM